MTNSVTPPTAPTAESPEDKPVTLTTVVPRKVYNRLKQLAQERASSASGQARLALSEWFLLNTKDAS